MNRMSSMLLLVFCLIFAQVTSSSTPCLMRCKDDHMLHVQKTLGEVTESSTEFLFPIETIIQNSNSLQDVFARVDSNCKLNLEYHVCLSRCPKSKEQNLLVMGLKPWMYMCGGGRETNFRAVVPCLWNFTTTFEHACTGELFQLKSVLTTLTNLKDWKSADFRRFCGSIYEYDECYVKGVAKKCGRKVGDFLKGLSDVNNATMLELFSVDRSLQKLLPKECTARKTSPFQQTKRDQTNTSLGQQQHNAHYVNLIADSESKYYEDTTSRDEEEIKKLWTNTGHKYICRSSFLLFPIFLFFCLNVLLLQ